MAKKNLLEYITNDNGLWWSWSMRCWISEKKPVMGAAIEIQMATRSDSSARVLVESVSSS